jgi:tetratricopeptide (TPR) repeat protein
MIAELGSLLEGRYRIESDLGHGGMALVFRAWDLRHDRAVALKVLRPELASSISMQRFLAETRTSARLHHPHLLPVLDSGSAGTYLFYVMPLVEGGTLRDRLASSRPMSVEQTASLGAEIADALDYLHRQGQVHRDVKPENILLSEDHAYLSDLGIARALAPARREFLTETGMTPGTARYMSPEQASGVEQLDGRSDLYSLGVVLRECLGDQTAPGLRALLQRMSAPKPDDRPRTAGEARDALRPFAQTGTAPISRTPHQKAVWALAAVGAAIAVVTALFAARSQRTGAGAYAASDSLLLALPFEVHGNRVGLELAESVPSLLCEALNGERVTRCRDTRPAFEYVRTQRVSLTDAAARRTVVRRFRARSYLYGDATALGNRVRIAARMVQAGDRDSLLASAVEEGPADSLSAVVSRLAVQLLAESSKSMLKEDVRAGNPRRPLAAVRAYLDGEAARIAGDFEDAMRRYDTAIESDSAFALAWMRLGQVLPYVTFDRPRAIAVMDRAVALSGPLSSRGRLMAKGYAAISRGVGAEARTAFQQVIDSDPWDFDALEALALTINVYAVALGWDRGPLADIDHRLLELDPSHFDALQRELNRAVQAKNVPRADSLLDRLERLDLPHVDREMVRVQRLMIHGRSEEALRILRESRDPDLPVMGVDPFLRDGDFERAIAVGDAIDSPRNPEHQRLYARIRNAWIEMSRGQWNAARARLVRAREINPGIADIYIALMACELPRLDEVEYTRSRVALASHLMSEEQFSGTPGGSIYQQIEGSWTATRLYALGLLDAATGRRSGAQIAARKLRRLGGSASERAWAELYATGIDARLLASEGRFKDALTVLDRSSSQSQFGSRIGLRTLTLERYLRIQLLASLGRHEDALTWGQFFNAYWFDMVDRPRFHLLKARSLHELGREADARTEYESLVRRLDRPDSLYVPLVEQARLELRSLASS